MWSDSALMALAFGRWNLQFPTWSTREFGTRGPPHRHVYGIMTSFVE